MRNLPSFPRRRGPGVVRDPALSLSPPTTSGPGLRGNDVEPDPDVAC